MPSGIKHTLTALVVLAIPLTSIQANADEKEDREAIRDLVPCAWFKPTAFRRYALARSRAEVPLSLIGDSDGGRLDGGVSEWQPYAA